MWDTIINAMKKYISLFAFSLILFSACKKTELSRSPIALLTAKPWKYAKTDRTPEKNPANSIIYPAQDCDADDVFQYTTSGKVHLDRGAVQCDTDEEKTESVDYKVSEDGTRITIEGETYDILELSATQLKYYAPVSIIIDENTTNTGVFIVVVFEH